jgi:F0F1-type ATP synthase membrane subunit b/b'
LHEARQQGQKILDGAKKENERLRIELSTQLQAELEQLRLRTQSSLSQERQALLDQWRKESSALVLAASEKILQQVMDQTLHARLQYAAQQKLNEPEMILA